MPEWNNMWRYWRPLYNAEAVCLSMPLFGYDSNFWTIRAGAKHNQQWGPRLDIYHSWAQSNTGESCHFEPSFAEYLRRCNSQQGSSTRTLFWLHWWNCASHFTNSGTSIVYNGHKHVHALKFQSVVLPNGLVGHLYGPVDKLCFIFNTHFSFWRHHLRCMNYSFCFYRRKDARC